MAVELRGWVAMDQLHVTLTLAEDGSYIRCAIMGTVTAADVRAVLHDLSALAAEHGLRAVLVDARTRVATPKLLDAFVIATTLARHARLPFVFATVVSSDLKRHRVIERVARERGVILQYFTDEQAAIAWLRAA